MIALDTNLLINAHRRGAPAHLHARTAMERAAAHALGWGVAATCISEFWSIVTHPTALDRPSSPARARAFLEALRTGGGMQVWHPRSGFSDRLVELAADLDVAGPRIFDLQIGLSARENGATELWTYDRRFVRVPGLRVRQPPD